jgi:hypothetical protein
VSGNAQRKYHRANRKGRQLIAKCLPKQITLPDNLATAERAKAQQQAGHSLGA